MLSLKSKIFLNMMVGRTFILKSFEERSVRLRRIRFNELNLLFYVLIFQVKSNLNPNAKEFVPGVKY